MLMVVIIVVIHVIKNNMNHEIIDAIQNQNLIEIVYEDQWLLVQPYCYGATVNNSECLIAFIVDADASEAISNWNNYDLTKIDEMNVLKATFYNPGNSYEDWITQMEEIYAKL